VSSTATECLVGVISILLHIFLFYLYLYDITFYLSGLIAVFSSGDGLNTLSSTIFATDCLKVTECLFLNWDL